MSLLKRSFGKVAWVPNGTGKANSSEFTLKMARNGKAITMVFPEMINAKAGTTCTAITLSKSLPTWARPTAKVLAYIIVRDAGTYATTPGVLEISTAGVVKIYPTNALGSWADSASYNTGMKEAHVTYMI
jgi:hypothetical protein